MKKLFSVLGLCAVLVPALSFAAYISAGKNLEINSSQTVPENVYVAGGSVTVAGPVNGDVLAAGGTVFLSSKIAHDIMAAGGTIDIAGAVAEDVRIAGGTLIVGGNFSGELVAVGGTVSVTPDAQIAKDSYVTGGTLNFAGNEAGNLTMAGGSMDVNGTIGKNLTVKNSGQLTIGPDAMIKGNLEYSAPVEATIAPGARILGTTTFHKVESAAAANNYSGAAFLFGLFTLWILWKLLAVLTATYIVWYVWRKDSTAVAHEATTHFGRSLLRGFIFIVAVPVAVILAFMTVLGALVGIFGILIYIALLILAVPAMVIFASSFIIRKTDLRWYHILFGAIVVQVVSVIPFIGGLATCIAYLASLGALLGVIRPKFGRNG